MKVGSGNRGQLRPHFGSRSPPFLVAALCVGLGILGISYYSLSNQYTSIESQLISAVHKYDLIDKESEDVRKQLELKTDEFDKVKETLEQKEIEIADLKKQFADKDASFIGLNTKLKTLEHEVEENRKRLETGNELKKAMETLQAQKNEMERDLRQQIDQLTQSNNELKSQYKSWPQPTTRPLSSDVYSEKLKEDPSYRSKFNVDTDVEPGVKPVILEATDVNLVKIPSSLPNKTRLNPSADENRVAIDTNHSKEVQDEFPMPNKTNEEEISKGSQNDTENNNHVDNDKK